MHDHELSRQEKTRLEHLVARHKPGLVELLGGDLAKLSPQVKEELEDILSGVFADNLTRAGEPNPYGLLVDELSFSLQKAMWPERWRSESETEVDRPATATRASSKDDLSP